MEKLEFSITKNTVEQYKIRCGSTGMYWADIVIDYNGNTGRIQIASDYGSWQNYWGGCGCSFKEFLTQIDMSYFACKVGEGRWFDLEATKKRMYQDIKEARKDKSITAEEANDICREAKIIFEDSCSAEAYKHLVMDSRIIWEFYKDPCCIPFETTISPQFKRFFNEAWQCFIDELKKELSVKEL